MSFHSSFESGDCNWSLGPPTPEASSPYPYAAPARRGCRGRSRNRDNPPTYTTAARKVADHRSRSPPRNYQGGDGRRRIEYPLTVRPDLRSANMSFDTEDGQLSSDRREHPHRRGSTDTYIPPYARAESWRSRRGLHEDQPSGHPRYCSPATTTSASFNSANQTSASNRGSGPPDDPDRTKPKNFFKPLTCFYWFNQGQCSKTDDDCWYAHWETGTIAQAPVRLTNNPKDRPVAGRSAARASELCVSQPAREHVLAARQTSIEARETVLGARKDSLDITQQDLQERETSINIHEAAMMSRDQALEARDAATRENEQKVKLSAQRLNLVIASLSELFGEASRAAADARQDLLKYRATHLLDPLLGAGEGATTACNPYDNGNVLNVIGGFLAALNGFDSRIGEIKAFTMKHMEDHERFAHRGDSEALE